MFGQQSEILCNKHMDKNLWIYVYTDIEQQNAGDSIYITESFYCYNVTDIQNNQESY